MSREVGPLHFVKRWFFISEEGSLRGKLGHVTYHAIVQVQIPINTITCGNRATILNYGEPLQGTSRATIDTTYFGFLRKPSSSEVACIWETKLAISLRYM